MRRTALFTCCLALAGPAAAQDDLLSTPSLLQGCEALTENAPTASDMQTGACAGSVATALSIGRLLERVCMPEDGTVIAAARIVIAYIYDSAERRGQRFGVVALQALQSQWPCGQ